MSTASHTSRPRMVISAVNLVEGGTLRVLQRFAKEASLALAPDWDIVALVHDKKLLPIEDIRILEFPKVKQSWLKRVWFEYWQCRRLSQELQADVWVALHDMTPNVVAQRQVVYCHNPSPFYPIALREALLDWKLLAFRLFYGSLYRINLGRNDMVVVQQDWLRKEFIRRYGSRNVVVARPVSSADTSPAAAIKQRGNIFLYPTLPRPFKNVELICEAARILETQEDWSGEIRITIAGNENSYARELITKYGDLKSVKFIGLQSAAAMKEQYEQAHCLVFPSKRETWGLPLTEAKQHGLSILAADLPYARESVGLYDGVSFFPVDDCQLLAEKMRTFSAGQGMTTPSMWNPPMAPYAKDWTALIHLIASGLGPGQRTGLSATMHHD